MREKSEKTKPKKNSQLKNIEQLSKSLHKINKKIELQGATLFESLISESKITYIDGDRKYAIVLVDHLKKLQQRSKSLQKQLQQFKDRQSKNDQQLKYLRGDLINKEKQKNDLKNYKAQFLKKATQFTKKYQQMKLENSNYATQILSINNSCSCHKLLSPHKIIIENSKFNQNIGTQTQINNQRNKNLNFLIDKVIQIKIIKQPQQLNDAYNLKQQIQTAIKIIEEKSKQLKNISVQIKQCKMIKEQNERLRDQVKVLKQKSDQVLALWKNKMNKLLQGIQQQWMDGSGSKSMEYLKAAK